MAYLVEWRTQTGLHRVTYSSTISVGNHVEHCLRKGWEIITIRKVEDTGKERPSVIFTKRYAHGTKRRTSVTQDILDALYDGGSKTCLEIAEAIGSEYVSDHGKAESVRCTMYSMERRGLVEKVQGTRPIRWRVVE